MLDFIKASYKGKHPKHITPEISLWKLKQFVKAHPLFFKALKEFKHEIIYVIGNHDGDMVFPELQREFRKLVGNVNFCYHFDDGELHIEHGHRFDAVNYIQWKKAIVYKKGKKMLNIAPGTYAVMQYLVHMKKRFPKAEKLSPHEIALDLIPEVKADFKRIGRKLAVLGFFVLPFTKMFDPTYETKWKVLFQCLVKYLFTIITVNFDKNIKSISKHYPKSKVFVLGHTHNIVEAEWNGKKLFEVGTWREEYEIKNDKVYLKPRVYADVVVKNRKVVKSELVKYKVKKNAMKLDRFLK